LAVSTDGKFAGGKIRSKSQASSLVVQTEAAL
jgi:hypothetical protein